MAWSSLWVAFACLHAVSCRQPCHSECDVVPEPNQLIDEASKLEDLDLDAEANVPPHLLPGVQRIQQAYQPLMDIFAKSSPQSFVKGIRWLDIGGAEGMVASHMQQKYGAVTKTYDVFPARNSQVQRFDGSSLRAQEPADHSWDVISFFYVLHHAGAKQQSLLQEAHRLLKPGGFMAVTEDLDSDNNTIKQRNTAHDTNGIFRRPEAWTQMFTQAGFEVLHQGGVIRPDGRADGTWVQGGGWADVLGTRHFFLLRAK